MLCMWEAWNNLEDCLEWLPPWTEMMDHCMKLSEIVGPLFEVLVAGIVSRTGGYMADPGFEKPVFCYPGLTLGSEVAIRV